MENLKTWCVYCHTNKVNGKKYIGITGQEPTRRWQNGNHYDTQPYFWRAIQKYGWGGFQHEILYTDLSKENAEQLEVDLIKKHQTQDPNKGYNSADGGAARSGWHHTEEAKEKIGARTRGTHLSKTHKERIGAAQRGEKNHAFGKTLSDEHKAKMSAALIGRAVSEETRRRIRDTKTQKYGRRVECVCTGEVFESISGASESTGVRRSGISSCCNGRQKTAGGFYWRYTEAVRVSA